MKTYRDLKGPRGLPILGNVHQVDNARIHLMLENWADQYGPIYRIQQGPIRFVVVSEAEAIKRMCEDRPDGFRRWKAVQAVTTEWDLTGLMANEGANWRRQRRHVVAALNAVSTETVLPKLSACLDRLERKWERAADSGEPVDLYDDLKRMIFDFATQTVIGTDSNALESESSELWSNFDEIWSVLLRRMIIPFPYWRYVRLPKDRAVDRAVTRLREQLPKIIRDTRRRMRTGPATAPTNFLEAAIAAEDADDWDFSDSDILANLVTLVLESSNSAPQSAAWALYYCMEYPELFARARAEVDGLTGTGASVEAFAETERCPFLHAFSLEAQRLKMPATMMVLEPLEDTEILGYLIPKGTVLLLLSRYIGMQDANFGAAARFDPERWLRDGAERRCPHNIDAFVPFGGGPRLCPGRDLGMFLVRAALAMFCRRFDAEIADPGRPVEERQALVMFPVNLHVRMKRRAQ